MKKDMGGAATVLGLASLLMAKALDLRLRVLIPAVENSVSGAAFRPGDVYPSRKGLSVEIGNTDAEGRLVLADALALADEEAPDLIVDLATLTGAARTALGPEIVPFYTAHDELAAALAAAGEAEADPLWRMPLWQNYADGLDSRIADTNHVTDNGLAGSITAALFLAKFVERAKAYAHFDIYGWNAKAKPGRPQGGEAQGLRALHAVIARGVSAIL
jgi:leucyl aminopeptidase